MRVWVRRRGEEKRRREELSFSGWVLADDTEDSRVISTTSRLPESLVRGKTLHCLCYPHICMIYRSRYLERVREVKGRNVKDAIIIESAHLPDKNEWRDISTQWSPTVYATLVFFSWPRTDESRRSLRRSRGYRAFARFSNQWITWGWSRRRRETGFLVKEDMIVRSASVLCGRYQPGGGAVASRALEARAMFVVMA